jgi:hypothetical protein
VEEILEEVRSEKCKVEEVRTYAGDVCPAS